MRLSSSLPLLHSLGLASLWLLLACSSSSDRSSASAGESGAGTSSAGTSSAGDSSAGGSGDFAGSNFGGADAADAGRAGAGHAGSTNTAGSAGVVAHGGAPTVDYGDPQVPPAQWTNITGTLAGMQSECGNMGPVFASPFVDLLVLGVARQGLWSSTDGGATYTKLGSSGDPILNRLTTVAWDPSASNVFYVAGIYGWESPFTDGVFKTTDTGASFSGYKTLSAIQSHNDSISIDFNDPDRKTLLSGGHEQAGFMFRSTDAGATWSNVGASLPTNFGFCTTALVLDAKRLLIGCSASYSGKAGAILRSSDGGDTWTQVSDQGVVNQPLWAYDGSIYWGREAGGLLKSVDQGLTFQQVSAKISSRVAPIELPDGRIVSVADKVLTASSDGGKTWQAIGTAIPFDPYAIAYSPFRRAFFATYFDCNSVVLPDAIARYGFDFKH
ncbi:MAG: hypothetical protein WDO74_13575 [Pseudomonadota bacterium]